ncbi:hypothetical protein ACJX0J_008763, partial [Zea mays]
HPFIQDANQFLAEGEDVLETITSPKIDFVGTTLFICDMAIPSKLIPIILTQTLFLFINKIASQEEFLTNLRYFGKLFGSQQLYRNLTTTPKAIGEVVLDIIIIVYNKGFKKPHITSFRVY